jgi:hypothetical protein
MKTTNILRICAFLLLIALGGLVYANVSRVDWSTKPITLACDATERNIDIPPERRVVVIIPICQQTAWVARPDDIPIFGMGADRPVWLQLVWPNRPRTDWIYWDPTHTLDDKGKSAVRFRNPGPHEVRLTFYLKP